MTQEIVINIDVFSSIVFFLGKFAGIFLCMAQAKFAKFFKRGIEEAVNDGRN